MGVGGNPFAQTQQNDHIFSTVNVYNSRPIELAGMYSLHAARNMHACVVWRSNTRGSAPDWSRHSERACCLSKRNYNLESRPNSLKALVPLMTRYVIELLPALRQALREYFVPG